MKATFRTLLFSFFETLEFLGAKIDPKMDEQFAGKINPKSDSVAKSTPGSPKGPSRLQNNTKMVPRGAKMEPRGAQKTNLDNATIGTKSPKPLR